MNKARIHIIREAENWANAWPEAERDCEALWLELLRHLTDIPAKPEISLLLTDDNQMRQLNKDFRGQDKPTNVLSFPAEDDDYLGDIALAYGVIARESQEQEKPLRHHAQHLVLHAMLHLLGFNHETGKEAEIMESIEVAVLDRCGIKDPYLIEECA